MGRPAHQPYLLLQGGKWAWWITRESAHQGRRSRDLFDPDHPADRLPDSHPDAAGSGGKRPMRGEGAVDALPVPSSSCALRSILSPQKSTSSWVNRKSEILLARGKDIRRDTASSGERARTRPGPCAHITSDMLRLVAMGGSHWRSSCAVQMASRSAPAFNLRWCGCDLPVLHHSHSPLRSEARLITVAMASLRC